MSAGDKWEKGKRGTDLARGRKLRDPIEDFGKASHELRGLWSDCGL